MIFSFALAEFHYEPALEAEQGPTHSKLPQCQHAGNRFNGREHQCGTAIPESELAPAIKVRVPNRTTNKSFQMNDQPPDSD
jgi:hypothetical protein